jgi:hypothetical protein
MLYMSSESVSSDNKKPEKDKDKDEQEDKGVLFDKGEFPGWVQSEFDRFYGTQTAEKTRYLAKTAQNESFVIDVYPINTSLDDPDADIDAEDLKVNGEATATEFKVHDATTAQWQTMVELRGDVAGAEQHARDRLKNAPKGGLTEEEMENLRETVKTKSARSYYYQAKVFFRMSKELYNRSEGRQVRDACDAMTHRTLLSIPKSARG